MPGSFLTVIDLQLKRFLLKNTLLVKAFRIKEFKLKNLVLIKEKVKIGLESQMWSCSKIVRIADEVSPYV